MVFERGRAQLVPYAGQFDGFLCRSCLGNEDLLGSRDTTGRFGRRRRGSTLTDGAPIEVCRSWSAHCFAPHAA
jgi:hypothetical protein